MSDPRRASDDLLIQLVREGRHDAEIGIRLGITTGQVRERKAQLRGKLGEEQYHRTVDVTIPRSRSRRRRIWLAAIGILVLFFSGLLLAANLLVGEGEEIAAVRVVPTATPRATPRPPAVVSVGIERFDDTGPFLSLGEESGLPLIGSAENRAGMSVVDLHNKAFVSQSEFAQWLIVGGSRGQLRIRSVLGGRAVDVLLSAGHQSTRIRTLAAGVGPVAEVSSQFDSISPILLVRAYDQNGKQLRTHVTVDGRLQIAREPIPATWVVERTTGSRLEIGEATAFGQIALAGDVAATTFCGLPASDGIRCGVTWNRARGWRPPAEAVVSCTGPTSMRFEANGLRLDFSRGLSLNRGSDLTCEPQTVPEGMLVIPEGDWEVVASTSAGEQLSVGVTSDGTLFIGTFTGRLDCPCLSQP